MTIREIIPENLSEREDLIYPVNTPVRPGVYAVIRELHPQPIDKDDGHNLLVQVINKNKIVLRLPEDYNQDPKAKMQINDPANLRCRILKCQNKTTLYKDQINSDARINSILSWQSV